MCDVNEYDEVNQYDEEPVAYCEDCLSLAIMGTSFHGLSYCNACGSTRVAEVSIKEYIELYKARYGRDPLVDEEEENDIF